MSSVEEAMSKGFKIALVLLAGLAAGTYLSLRTSQNTTTQLTADEETRAREQVKTTKR